MNFTHVCLRTTLHIPPDPGCCSLADFRNRAGGSHAALEERKKKTRGEKAKKAERTGETDATRQEQEQEEQEQEEQQQEEEQQQQQGQGRERTWAKLRSM